MWQVKWRPLLLLTALRLPEWTEMNWYVDSDRDAEMVLIMRMDKTNSGLHCHHLYKHLLGVPYWKDMWNTFHRFVKQSMWYMSLLHCIILVNLVFFSYYTLRCFTNFKSYIYSFRKLSMLSPFYSSNIFNAGCIEWLHNKSDDFKYHWYSHYSCKWGHRLGFQTEAKPVVTQAKSGIHTFP